MTYTKYIYISEHENKYYIPLNQKTRSNNKIRNLHNNTLKSDENLYSFTRIRPSVSVCRNTGSISQVTSKDYITESDVKAVLCTEPDRKNGACNNCEAEWAANAGWGNIRNSHERKINSLFVNCIS